MTRSAFFTFSRRSSSVTMESRPPLPAQTHRISAHCLKFPAGLLAIVRVLLRIPIAPEIILRPLWEGPPPGKMYLSAPPSQKPVPTGTPGNAFPFSPAGSDSLRNHHSPDRKRNSVSAFSPLITPTPSSKGKLSSIDISTLSIISTLDNVNEIF